MPFTYRIGVGGGGGGNVSKCAFTRRKRYVWTRGLCFAGLPKYQKVHSATNWTTIPNSEPMEENDASAIVQFV